MKNWTLILALSAQIAYGQSISESEIMMQVDKIDSIKRDSGFVYTFYPNMSACGGAVEGYFQNGTLSLIESTYNAELGYSSKIVYYKDDSIIRIVYHEHHADWETYDNNYPNDQYKWNPSKMTYTDERYTLNFADKPILYKMKDNTWIEIKINQELVDELIGCAGEMKRLLVEE
jgi:hypothetical protein